MGLSLSYALTLTTSQVFLTRWFCNLDNHIISVERIKQYMNIPSEPPAIVEGNRPPPSWPSEGHIDLQDLQVGSPSSSLLLPPSSSSSVLRKLRRGYRSGTGRRRR